MIEIQVPALGESVTEALVVKWLKSAGESVHFQETLVELETEKVTLEVYAPCDGILYEQRLIEGTRVAIGDILGTLQSDNAVIASPIPTPTPKPKSQNEKLPDELQDRLTKKIPLSPLRQTIAKRLKEAQNTAAILTTFNEIDMSSVIEMRARYKDLFEKEHGVRLGYMSFFIKAVIEGLRRVPALNAFIENDSITSHNYYDISVAIATAQGLVTPVIRDADLLDFVSLEKNIALFASKAKEGHLAMGDLKGGTFTLTNGGVFGSLLSTPILNPPQSGILGMHKIQDRPVVINGQIVIRPMMYVALSYDHRLVDGKDAVTFLTTVKDFVEMPGRFSLGI